MSDDLERRVLYLERRLKTYHERLEDALEHDRQFQLGATWGVVNALLALGAFFGVLYAANKWLDLDNWIVTILASIAAWVAWYVAFTWSDKGRAKDLGKLSKLPKWAEGSDWK